MNKAAANNYGCSFKRTFLLKLSGQTPVPRLWVRHLAGLAVGIWKSLDDVRATWLEDKRFASAMPADEVQRRIDGWHSAVKRA